MRIVIIGQGNVALNMEQAFRKKALEVTRVSSREGLDTIPQNGDVYIYAVRDNALAEVVQRVSVPRRALHIHTSGTIPISVFGEDKPHAGILYPIYSFSKADLIPDFSVVPLFIEGNGIDDISAIYSVALMLSPHVYEATQADRERLHLCGVLVNNFPNALYGLAKTILEQTHIPFAALLPIIDETAQQVHTLTPSEAQTGPAKRNDTRIMEHHLSLLPTDEQKQIYRLLSELIRASSSLSDIIL